MQGPLTGPLLYNLNKNDISHMQTTDTFSFFMEMTQHLPASKLSEILRTGRFLLQTTFKTKPHQQEECENLFKKQTSRIKVEKEIKQRNQHTDIH